VLGQLFLARWLTSTELIPISLYVGSLGHPNICGHMTKLEVKTAIPGIGACLIHDVRVYFLSLLLKGKVTVDFNFRMQEFFTVLSSP
jgi:hypothetical protein